MCSTVLPHRRLERGHGIKARHITHPNSIESARQPIHSTKSSEVTVPRVVCGQSARRTISPKPTRRVHTHHRSTRTSLKDAKASSSLHVRIQDPCVLARPWVHAPHRVPHILITCRDIDPNPDPADTTPYASTQAIIDRLPPPSQLSLIVVDLFKLLVQIKWEHMAGTALVLLVMLASHPYGTPPPVLHACGLMCLCRGSSYTTQCDSTETSPSSQGVRASSACGAIALLFLLRVCPKQMGPKTKGKSSCSD